MVKLYGDCIPLCIVFSDARKRKEIETFHEHVNIVVPKTPVISGYESFFSRHNRKHGLFSRFDSSSCWFRNRAILIC
jgi:hypothetical protein